MATLTDQELRDLVASLAIKSEELSKAQKKTDEQMKKTDEQMKKTDEQMKKTDKKLEKMGINLAGISHNNGDMAEEFFYRSLQEKLSINGVQYDDITRNALKYRKGIKEEYDIILTNGNVIEIVEVKYKVHPNDLDKLERKKENFKKLFPIYSDYTVHASIAGMTMPDEVIDQAKERGFHALVARGNHVEEL